MDKIRSVIDKDHKYYMNTFGERIPIYFTHGEGIFLYGADGKKYTDLLGGIAVNVLGHGNKALVKAISEQASKLIHTSNLYYIENQALLAERLISLAPGMAKVFFANSGAEANEGAIKLARAYFYKTGKPRSRIVSALNSFHGRTLATATATGQDKYSKPFAPLPEGFIHIPYNDIDAALSAINDDTCAVMLEMIQGESGIVPASYDFIRAVADACVKSGALLIIDEIQTGMGRTGTFFAYEKFGIKPDIVTIAKGLGGGVPIGALLAGEKAASAFSPGDHGSTFGGNPLACAAALAVLDEYDAASLTAKADKMGRYFIECLQQITAATG
ncbi:MAG: acetylornithine/succinylornithine family transaminase, partial [Saccharofermentanales bacterium]